MSSAAQPHDHNNTGGGRSRNAPFEVASISYRDYFQVQLDLMEERCLARYAEQTKNLEQRLLAQQTAIDKAEVALNTRLEAMNEIRSQLATQRADFVTIDRMDSILNPLASDRKALADKFDLLVSQTATQAGLIREQHQKDLDTLRDRMEQGFRTQNADIRSLREARSAEAGVQASARDMVPWLALGCTGLIGVASILLTVIGMIGAGVIFLVTHG